MSKLFLKGNEAVAEAAVRGGCRFFAGYPITPQNEIPEYLSKRLPEVGGAFVQGESELASINMVIGASYIGTRAMTSSSGPGLSLMSEGLSTMAATPFPAVILNVMRGGPGTGAIQGAQMDYLQATKAPGHGAFRLLTYAPSTIQEAVALTMEDLSAGNMAGHAATVEALERLLDAVCAIRIGDETIANACDRHRIRSAMMKGA